MKPGERGAASEHADAAVLRTVYTVVVPGMGGTGTRSIHSAPRGMGSGSPFPFVFRQFRHFSAF